MYKIYIDLTRCSLTEYMKEYAVRNYICGWDIYINEDFLVEDLKVMIINKILEGKDFFINDAEEVKISKKEIEAFVDNFTILPISEYLSWGVPNIWSDLDSEEFEIQYALGTLKLPFVYFSGAVRKYIDKESV